VKDQYQQTGSGDDLIIEKLIQETIELRNDARKRKDFAASDAIRDKLLQIGIVLEDKPGSTEWRRK
jgi:cysteinyl-tRNA synthetase